MCGTLPETLILFQTKICDFPYPISDLIKNLIPYFRPEALERLTRCYGRYTVVGVMTGLGYKKNSDQEVF